MFIGVSPASDLPVAEFFLGSDAKFLFLVNNEETEVFETDFLVEQAVCADDDVNFSGFEVGKDLLFFLGRTEPIEVIYCESEGIEPILEGFVVLKGKNGSWDKYCHLFSGNNCLEGGADGDFRFSKTNVAANEAIHGIWFLHILLDVIG